MLDEPRDEARLVAAHAVLEAERFRVDGAELRVVAAAALGDVVEESREVRDLGFLEPLHDRAARRELVVEARQREAPQVLDDEQRVRVDRIRMEQVVLHAADDAAERRDVQPEHAVGVHALQRARDALRRAQDVEEQPMVPRVLAKLLVDEPEVLLDERDRARVDAAQIEVLLEQQEDLEQRRRLAREDLVVGDLEIAVAALEARAERHGRLVLVEQDRFLEELQQHLVQAAELHDRAVVALHELLDGEREARVLVAEHLRELDLVVEQQPVLAPARQKVQAEADAPEKCAALRQGSAAGPASRTCAVRGRASVRVPKCRCASQPIIWMSRKPAGAAFDVRLEVVGRVVVARVAGLLLLELRVEELGAVPHPVRADAHRQLGEQLARARAAAASP